MLSKKIKCNLLYMYKIKCNAIKLTKRSIISTLKMALVWLVLVFNNSPSGKASLQCNIIFSHDFFGFGEEKHFQKYPAPGIWWKIRSAQLRGICHKLIDSCHKCWRQPFRCWRSFSCFFRCLSSYLHYYPPFLIGPQFISCLSIVSSLPSSLHFTNPFH